MPGQKRAADTELQGPKTRSKVARSSQPKLKGKGKRGPKASMGATSFKSHALPLHVNVTHTPPVIGDDDTKDAAQADPGFIGATTLVPSTFATGSYGWKGNKRITVELENSESGQKEKVQVMLTINATVLGSKNAKDDATGEEVGEDGALPASAEEVGKEDPEQTAALQEEVAFEGTSE